MVAAIAALMVASRSGSGGGSEHDAMRAAKAAMRRAGASVATRARRRAPRWRLPSLLSWGAHCAVVGLLDTRGEYTMLFGACCFRGRGRGAPFCESYGRWWILNL